MTFTLQVNGQARTVDADGSTPLLWVLRDHLLLTGTKFGCGIGVSLLAMVVGGLGRSARRRRERSELLARERDVYPEETRTPATAVAGRHRIAQRLLAGFGH